MASFYNLTSGATAQAQDVQQLINALNGTVGQGVPLSPTAVNDSVNFALTIKNTDATNSRALQVLRANGNVLLQADVNGVVVSPDGGVATDKVVNLSATQTLSNKTFSNLVTISSGGLQISAGNLGLGAAPSSNVGTALGGTLTASSGVAYGYWAASNLSAAANNDILTAVNIAPTYLDNSKTGVAHYGVRVAAPSAGGGDTTGLSAAGDICLGGGGFGSGLATTDTVGFVFLPVMSGAPTGAPSTTGDHANHVPMVYDQTNQKLWVRQGGTWRGVVLS